MKDCPNCGRPTLRTEDWACQWCGYPLLSKSYKKIPKTYREIKEEALGEWGISQGERMSGESSEPDEHKGESVAETVIEPEQTEEIKEEAIEEPAPESEPEKMEESLTETEKELELESEPITKPEGEQVGIALSEKSSEPAPEPTKKRDRKSPPKPASKAVPESDQASQKEPEIKEEVETEETPGVGQGTDTETVPEQNTMNEVSVSPEQMSGKAPISIEELNPVFSGEKAAANAGLMGRTLQVAGVVDKIFLREHLDIRYVILAGAGRKGMRNVRCTFEPEQSSALRRLAEGQKVIVQGEYGGLERNILFKNCAIIG